MKRARRSVGYAALIDAADRRITALIVTDIHQAKCPHTAWNVPADRCASCGITAEALAESRRPRMSDLERRGAESLRIHANLLRSWEPGFIADILARGTELTRRQRETLWRLVVKNASLIGDDEVKAYGRKVCDAVDAAIDAIEELATTPEPTKTRRILVEE